MEEIDWRQREKDRKIVELVRNFLLAVNTFRQLYEQHREKSLHFADMAKFVDDRGQSILFALKEISHSLFRQNSEQISEGEQLFDLLVGSIFHLSMKMREDLYQLEIYGPKYEVFLKKITHPASQEKLIFYFQKILSKTESVLKEEMEEVKGLIENLVAQFPDFLYYYRENGLLIRFFLEEPHLLEEVFGKNAVANFFLHLYGPEQFKPYLLAGESYFQGAFYGKARQAFLKALEKKPGDEALLFKICLCEGLEQFYSFAPLLALQSLEKCLTIAGQVDFPENYKNLIRKICLRIEEEFPGRRKSDQHRNLLKISQELLQKLDKLTPRPTASG